MEVVQSSFSFRLYLIALACFWSIALSTFVSYSQILTIFAACRAATAHSFTYSVAYTPFIDSSCYRMSIQMLQLLHTKFKWNLPTALPVKMAAIKNAANTKIVLKFMLISKFCSVLFRIEVTVWNWPSLLLSSIFIVDF